MKSQVCAQVRSGLIVPENPPGPSSRWCRAAAVQPPDPPWRGNRILACIHPSKGVVDGHLGAPDHGVAGAAAGGQHRVANQRDGDYGLCLPQAGFLPPRTRSRSCPRFQEEPASGVPMCHRAAPAATVGLTVLPLMLFHQIQLTVCASLARRYAARPVTPQPVELVRLVGVGISDRVVRGGHAKALQAMPSWERRLTTRRVVRELGCMPADQSLSGMYSPFS
jgi:hypothetical protein